MPSRFLFLILAYSRITSLCREVTDFVGLPESFITETPKHGENLLKESLCLRVSVARGLFQPILSATLWGCIAPASRPILGTMG